MSDDPTAAQPLFVVVHGNPTDAELAAVLSVLSARARQDDVGRRPVAVSGWSAHWRAVRAPLAPGAGAWRASSRTR